MTKEDILHHFQDINFRYNDCMMYDDLSRMLDELIAENKGEWIPVIERLPKDGELVLCSVADGNHSVVINCFENQSYWRDGKIYAWQPLPEPYKAESEEKKMSKLRPCPFCGDEVHIQYESDVKAFSVWHKGTKCKFIEPFWINGDEAKSLNESYKVWNERVETTKVNNGNMNITLQGRK